MVPDFDHVREERDALSVCLGDHAAVVNGLFNKEDVDVSFIGTHGNGLNRGDGGYLVCNRSLISRWSL